MSSLSSKKNNLPNSLLSLSWLGPFGQGEQEKKLLLMRSVYVDFGSSSRLNGGPQIKNQHVIASASCSLVFVLGLTLGLTLGLQNESKNDGMVESRNSGVTERRKITPNPKRWNRGITKRRKIPPNPKWRQITQNPKRRNRVVDT